MQYSPYTPDNACTDRIMVSLWEGNSDALTHLVYNVFIACSISNCQREQVKPSQSAWKTFCGQETYNYHYF